MEKPLRLFIFFIYAIFNGDLCAQTRETFILKGIIDTIPYTKYFVNYNNEGMIVQDTIVIDENCEFEYSGYLTEPGIFNLSVPNTFNPQFVGNQSIYTFWIEPGKTIHFKGKKDWLVNGKYGLSINSTQYDLKNSDMDSIVRNYRMAYQTAYKKRENETKRILSDDDRAIIYDSVFNSFVSLNPKHYYRLYLLSNRLVTSKTDYSTIEKLLEELPDSLKDTYLAKDIRRRIKVNTQLSIGSVLPDFEQMDTTSRLVKISSYRGRYVLVDFWASWCAPCRSENPYLVQAYKKHKDKGFEIIGISLDEKKQDWLKAIQDDALLWVHLSDLKGFDNDVAKQFYIHAIPQNFLLDPKGVIIAKNLRGKGLEAKLEEIFK